jgi:hypothetical protein
MLCFFSKKAREPINNGMKSGRHLCDHEKINMLAWLIRGYVGMAADRARIS